MSRTYIFADEAGNFDFSRKTGASHYFIITTITLRDCGIAGELLALRRELILDGHDLAHCFHCTEEAQSVRDKVFDVIRRHDVRIDATVVEKSKTIPGLQDALPFYKNAWFHHLKYVFPLVARRDHKHLIVAAGLSTKEKRVAWEAAVHDVVNQVKSIMDVRSQCWPVMADPCLQVADYCCWAIQRKWERHDARSYDLIKHMVRTEFDLFGIESKHYY